MPLVECQWSASSRAPPVGCLWQAAVRFGIRAERSRERSCPTRFLPHDSGRAYFAHRSLPLAACRRCFLTALCSIVCVYLARKQRKIQERKKQAQKHAERTCHGSGGPGVRRLALYRRRPHYTCTQQTTSKKQYKNVAANVAGKNKRSPPHFFDSLSLFFYLDDLRTRLLNSASDAHGPASLWALSGQLQFGVFTVAGCASSASNRRRPLGCTINIPRTFQDPPISPHLCPIKKSDLRCCFVSLCVG